MPKSFDELHQKAALVCGLVDTIQVDIMDGIFVPSFSWPMHGIEKNEFIKIINGEISLPFWKEINYEADLMIKNPDESIEEWVSAGFSRIIIHLESTTKITEILKEWSQAIEIGVALNVDTPNEDIYQFLEKARFVQFMGIKKIGYQGQPFDGHVIHKIMTLRKLYPDIIISIDGGVNFETASHLITAGVNRMVVGSAIWKCDSIAFGIEKFRRLCMNIE